MKMIYTKLFLLTISTALICSYAFLDDRQKEMISAYRNSHLYTKNSSGAPNGRTGAPGESDCTSCHTGTVNSGAGVNALILKENGVQVTEWELGKTYDVELTIAGTTTRRGFQATARTTADNLTAGAITSISTSTALSTVGGKEYITHKSGSVGNSTFNFQWTAPSAIAGEVRFYVASNVSNANNSTSGDQIYLSQHNFNRKLIIPVASYTADQTSICEGVSVQFTSTSTGSPDSYNWTFPGGTPSSSTDPNPIVSYATAGQFDVTLTVSNADGNHTQADAAAIQVIAPVTLSLTSSTNPTGCGVADGIIDLNGNGNGNLSWTGTQSGSMNAVSLPVQVSGLAAGTYNFVFDNGCVSTPITAQLNDPGAPAAPSISSSDTDNSICDGESLTLTSSVATGNLWSTGETTESIIVSSSGNYSVQQELAGCVSAASNIISVTVNQLPAAPSISSSDPDNILCAGIETALLTSSEATGNLWSTGETTPQITVSVAGNYTVKFTDANGCDSPESSVLTINVDLCDALAETENDLFQLFPNPVSEILHIQSKTNESLLMSLIDLQGKVLGTWEVPAGALFKLDVSPFESGVYQLYFNQTQRRYPLVIR